MASEIAQQLRVAGHANVEKKHVNHRLYGRRQPQAAGVAVLPHLTEHGGVDVMVTLTAMSIVLKASGFFHVCA